MAFSHVVSKQCSNRVRNMCGYIVIVPLVCYSVRESSVVGPRICRDETRLNAVEVIVRSI